MDGSAWTLKLFSEPAGKAGCAGKGVVASGCLVVVFTSVWVVVGVVDSFLSSGTLIGGDGGMKPIVGGGPNGYGGRSIVATGAAMLVVATAIAILGCSGSTGAGATGATGTAFVGWMNTGCWGATGTTGWMAGGGSTRRLKVLSKYCELVAATTGGGRTPGAGNTGTRPCPCSTEP